MPRAGDVHWVYTHGPGHYNTPLNPTFEKYLGNTPESNEYSPLAGATGLHPQTGLLRLGSLERHSKNAEWKHAEHKGTSQDPLKSSSSPSPRCF